MLSRVAAAAGLERVVVLGRTEVALPSELTASAAASAGALADGELRDSIVLLTGDATWEGLADARIVVAVDLAPAGSSLDAIAAARATAAAAGWSTPYSGIVHGEAGGGRTEGSLVVACRAGDDVEPLLETGPLSLALDPAIAGVDAAGPARVLIASYEITGPTGNGGIGTAYHSLAHTLAAAGNDVTVLFTGWMDPPAAAREPEWRARFAASGIEFALLGTPWDPPVRSPHHAVRRAYEFHRWLSAAHAERPFDIVHLPETLGHGAFAQTAKAMGLAYQDVEFVIGTHSSTRWVAECNREGIEQIDMLVTERLERLSVARADVILSPSAYLVDYMRDRAWELPERTFVQQYSRPQSVRRMAEDSAGEAAGPAPRELVFFGRLETRKGLEAFCDAVDLLVADGDCPFDRVTFVGRPERVLGEDSTAFVERRAADWGLDWTILPDLGHDEAIAHLRETPCVVAIPSLVDNSPNTVYEAVALGVPFIASRSGGTAEIIATEDLAGSTFDGWRNATTLEPPTFAAQEEPFDARALATALRAKAADAAGSVAPAVGDAAGDAVYDRWHRAIAARPATPPAAAKTSALTAAVCIVDADGDDLRRLSAALRDGTQQPLQIAAVVAPDAELDDAPADVELVRAAGRDAGPARRALAERLDADLLFVLRGHEQPDAAFVEQVCTAAAASGADLLTLISRDPAADRDTGIPRALSRKDVPADLLAFVPIAGPAIAAAVYPALSVGSYAIRRTALSGLGGYASDTWGETTDHELLARAALDGLRLEVHPEPLLTTIRDDAWTELRSRFIGSAPFPLPEGEAEIRRLRPFRRRLEGQLADLPALLTGAHRTVGESTDRVLVQIARQQELVDAYEARLKEYRDLVELYEHQKEELGAVLRDRDAALAAMRAPSALARAQQRMPRAARGPVSEWPRRGVRFARWRIELMRRKLR
ncbi:glycosyltransferase [Conexibacter stalactiti]|uniref:Glycosyltransferase n=1 Tax=Conexibacter stalactiti TaxID=1940611 RepID=A0ABU4HK21_9ACTN|nr:glycosyltransferase [Conexibacter stalactiti]MDW5593661.1 glycosyltransferase [Conexibacter stalactiti]MEC5034302.1 glycosyltransferase [Conexibacter stalactiti]